MTDSHGNEIGKIFVGGLSQATNDDKLRTYFSQLGEIDDFVVMMDNKTGRSRGFGYVKYKNAESVETVLQSKPHIIDFKEVDVKQCNVNMKGKNRRSLKIFVGGINLDHDSESIKRFFEQFGVVTDINLMMDQSKLRHRGFAFVGFEDENIVKKLITMHFVNINSNQVEIKAMEPPNFAKRFQQVNEQTITISQYGNNTFPISEQSINRGGTIISNCSTQSLWRPTVIQYQQQMAWPAELPTTMFMGTAQQYPNQWANQCEHPHWPSMNWPCPSTWYQQLPSATMWPSQPSNWLPILVANQASVQATKPHILAPPQTHINDHTNHLLAQTWSTDPMTVPHTVSSLTDSNWMSHPIEFDTHTNSFENPKVVQSAQLQSNLCGGGVIQSNSDSNNHFGNSVTAADYCSWFCDSNKELVNSNIEESIDASNPHIPGGGAGDFNRSTSQDSNMSYYATRN